MRRAREGHLGAGRPGDDAAGGVVPRREVELPVRVHVAGGDVAEIESRRPAAADVAHAAQHLGNDGALTLALSRLVGEAGGHQGRREIGLLAHLDRLVVADSAEPADRPVHASGAGVVDNADLRLPVDLDGDGDCIGRVAVDVVGGPVERVDDPAYPARALTQCPLLAEHGVVGPRFAQPFDDRALGFAVHLAHRIGGRGLRLDAQSTSHALFVHLPGCLGQVGRQGQQLLQLEPSLGPGACGGSDRPGTRLDVAFGGHR